MAIVVGVAFLTVALALIALTLLLILRIGFGRLESAIGIERDGPKRGIAAPEWRRPDFSGTEQGSPSGSRWQILLFADHSLASFPDLVAGSNRMHADIPDFEVVVLTRKTANLNAATARELGIEAPIVPVDQTFYDRFNVRVMPYGVLLDPQGIVRWASVASHEAPLRRELRLAREDAAADQAIASVEGALA
ncbi:MAG: TlpA family protein disulfide reductase [Thermomicrobiales bacterium]